MKIDFNNGRYSLADEQALKAIKSALPKVIDEHVITVRVLEFDDGSKSYLLDNPTVSPEKISSYLQDLHLKVKSIR